MDYEQPTLLVISGPNGAGKSTHIQNMLPAPLSGILSFNRDLKKTEFEQSLGLKRVPEELIPKKALEMMEEKLMGEMNRAIDKKEHFVLETPLSHPDFWRYIDQFSNRGYQVELYHLCLDNYSDCLDRVRHRVMNGGHDVDPRTMKGVYEQNLHYINDYYRDTFKSVELYDGMKVPQLLVKMENDNILYVRENSLKKT